MITASNGEKHLCWAGGVHEVDNAEQATKFKNLESCQNACNILPKKYKDAGYIPMVNGKNVDVDQEDDDEIFVGIEEKMRDIEELYTRMKKQATLASAKLAKCDRQIEDILHAIEFQQLNVVKGYNAYKRLHELRVIRRKYKDQIFIANSVTSSFGKPIQEGLLSKQLGGLDGRKYRVKYETDFFKG